MTKKELEKVVETSMKIDEDVAELASIYKQLEYYLSTCEKIIPTSESLHSMAVSIFINRNEKRRMDTYKTSQTTIKEGQKENKYSSDQRQCPSCKKIISVSISKDGKTPFFACWDCGVFINDDKTTTPMKRKTF